MIKIIFFLYEIDSLMHPRCVLVVVFLSLRFSNHRELHGAIFLRKVFMELLFFPHVFLNKHPPVCWFHCGVFRKPTRAAGQKKNQTWCSCDECNLVTTTSLDVIVRDFTTDCDDACGANPAHCWLADILTGVKTCQWKCDLGVMQR